METEGAVVWRALAADEVRRAGFAFYRTHPECGMAVHIERGELSLMCWCERCKDLRAYKIGDGQGSLPAA